MHIVGPAGRLEAILDLPRAGRAPSGEPPRAGVIFAHPHPQHGGTMHTKVVYQSAKALTRTGCAVLRFNFMGVGSSAGTFGGGPAEQEDFRAAIDSLHRELPGVPLWAAGFSFGAWVALECGATDDRISAIVGIAPPVAREGYAFEHILTSTKPKFLVQGDLDTICLLRDTRAFYSRLPEPKELVVLDGAGHLFEGRTMEVGEALEDLLGDFAG
jgi:uncharacterized protein